MARSYCGEDGDMPNTSLLVFDRTPRPLSPTRLLASRSGLGESFMREQALLMEQ